MKILVSNKEKLFPEWKILKTKDDWNCISCKKRIVKGNYAFGKSFAKICLNCLPEFLNHQQKRFQVGLERIDGLKAQLQTNEHLYKDTETMNELKQ